MSSLTGLSPNNPIRYLGAAVALATCVTRNRAPTGADYRQPETGKLYPFNTFWVVGKDPTTGNYGDLWYLSKIVANVGYWVMLSGGSIGPIESVTVDASSPPGTNPVVPTAGGVITVTGAQVAAGTIGANVIRTDSLAANTYTIQIQRSSTAASADSTKNGVSHFSSSQFSVDSLGFVQLSPNPIVTINGDTGSITGTTVTIFANNATQNSGSTVKFVNSGTISTLNVTDSNANVLIGYLAGNSSVSGTGNTGVGQGTLNALTSGINNAIFGYGGCNYSTTGSYNSGVGCEILQGMNYNGSYTTALGYQAGANYTGTESANICVGNLGTVGDNHIIRIGTQGSSTNQQNKCFIAGIIGNTVSNQELVTINSSTGQLGVTSSGASISTLTGDSGGTISPSGGNISLLGGGSTTGIVTTGTANTITSSIFNWVFPSTNNWTPVVYGGSSAGTCTYVTQNGVYARIGDIVFFSFDLLWTSHTGTGNMMLSGLPVNTAYASTNYPYAVMTQYIALPTGSIQTMFNAVNNSGTGAIVSTISGGAVSNVQMSATGALSTFGFYFGHP